MNTYSLETSRVISTFSRVMVPWAPLFQVLYLHRIQEIGWLSWYPTKMPRPIQTSPPQPLRPPPPHWRRSLPQRQGLTYLSLKRSPHMTGPDGRTRCHQQQTLLPLRCHWVLEVLPEVGFLFLPRHLPQSTLTHLRRSESTAQPKPPVSPVRLILPYKQQVGVICCPSLILQNI